MARNVHLDSERFSTRKTLNTIGGVWAENRGRRGDWPRDKNFNDANPFENGGRLSNWGNRKGWDQYYSQRSYREGKHGGSRLGESESPRRGSWGWQRSDRLIYEDVCETLARSSDVDAQAIEVDVQEGCVYLRGHVESRAMKKLAEWEIELISGVTDVQNLLTIDRGGAYAQE